MSRLTFENYGARARSLDNYTEIAGRYRIQKDAERSIVSDVISKLAIQVDDTLIDIGCGVGNLLIPLSFVCEQVTGIDHDGCIARLSSRLIDFKNVDLLVGNFLDVSVDRKFDKILCYGVLHCLVDAEEVIFFINKALDMLKPGGRALFGEIPNVSTKQRFLDSNSGKEFTEKWNRLIHNNTTEENDDLNLAKDESLVQFNDELMLRVLRETRANGYHSYVLSEPSHLPFGHTREDILIRKPA